MISDEYNKFIKKRRLYQLSNMSAFYLFLCLLLKIDSFPKQIKIQNHFVPISKEMKISIKHMKDLSKQAILLSKNNINNLENLNNYRYSLENELKKLKGQRENLWRKKSKIINLEDKANINTEIAKLKTKIDKYNKDIIYCYEIENRSTLLKNQLEKAKFEENDIDKTIMQHVKKEKTVHRKLCTVL